MLLVIGYGNPLRGDDGLGQQAAEMLLGAQIIRCHQLTPELAEPISQAERVIFIDAGIDEPPGAIIRTIVTPSVDAGALTHGVNPAALLAAARDWYGSAPPATLWALNGADFGYRDGLSPVVKAALPHLVAAIQTEMMQKPEPIPPVGINGLSGCQSRGRG